MLALALLAAPWHGRERTDAPPVAPYKIILVGDSTTAVHSGWGGAFCALHVRSSVACVNLARGGRSTRSYTQEGSWAVALAEARVAGYRQRHVLIQFGHNDQSSRPERWTDRTTEFPANLRRIVEEVRSAGAIPVLVTPLSRRQFKDGKLDNTLASWSDEVRKVATELKVPLVDLNARSAAVIAKIGAVGAMEFAQAAPTAVERAAAERGTTLAPAETPEQPPSTGEAGAPRGQVARKFDYTHLGDAGARAVAQLVVRDLAQAVPALGSQLVP